LVQYVPDGAALVAVEDSTLVLKASNALQERFETLWQCPRSVGGLCASERSFVVNTVTLTKNRGPRLNILIFFGSCDLPH